MEQLLIKRDTIAQFKQIAKTVYDDVLNQNILEAQFQDLKPLLGDNLYYDLINNVANYSELLLGGAYLDSGGVTHYNEGLNKCLTYYTYARYTMFGGVTDTPFSMVQKLNDQKSVPISTEFRKTMYTDNRQMAYNIWLSVEKYLILTNNILYQSNHCQPKTKSFKISKIS